MQDDFDCFLLACSHGQWKVVQELVNRHGLDPHVVNEVRVRACVHTVCACVHLKVMHMHAAFAVHTGMHHGYMTITFNFYSQEWLDRCPSCSRIWVC